MTLPNDTSMKTTLIIKQQNNIGNKNDININLNK